jgi:ankyrin repeat protein
MNYLSEDLQKKYINASKSILGILFINACSKGDLDSVAWILEHEELQYKIQYEHISNGLELACLNGHINVVQELHKNNKLHNVELYDSVVCALQENHKDVVQYLFHSKKNILHPIMKKAISENNLSLIKQVLTDSSVIELNKNNPRLNEGIIMIDQFGFELKKLLIEAYTNNNLELIRFYLNDAAIPHEARQTINFIGLINPVKYNTTIKPELSHYLLIYCEEKHIFLPNNILTKLFFKACEHNYLPLIKHLLLHSDPDKQVDIHANDDTALLHACHRGHLETVKYLLTSPELKEHANIHAQEDSPLLYAAKEGNLHLVDYLTTSPELKDHADIHAQNDYALYLAFKGDHKEVVEFFLESPKLKTHPDIFKNFQELKEQHLVNVNDNITETNYHYDMKVLTYLVYEHKIFTNNPEFTQDIEEMLESNPELKKAFRTIQLTNELNKENKLNRNEQKKLKI